LIVYGSASVHAETNTRSIDPPRRAALDDPTHPVIKAFGGERLNLWSMQPRTTPDVPRMDSSAISDRRDPPAENVIDAFLIDRLAMRGLQLAPRADRRTLARRLSFDLTGLPPTRDLVEAFVEDRRPDAVERLIERLMASPEFGAHWSRMWLDVVRYSDSNGYDWDEFRPMAWLYRDYVVRSLNGDKPYDQFLREQLAGDELNGRLPESAKDVDQWLATAYLRLGPYDNAAPLFDEQDRARAEWMFDLVETTGSAMLGLTFNCCRCHDHKYDPITQADYYRLQACFQPVEALDQYTYSPEAGIQRPPEAIAASSPRSPRSEEPPKQSDTPSLTTDQPADSDPQAAASAEPPRPPRDHVLLVSDRVGPVSATHILQSGDYQAPRETVEPGFLSLIDARPATLEPKTLMGSIEGGGFQAASRQTTGRRTALADWIVAADNPLTARVIVNRVWQGYFGVGIVATPNDFGYAGAQPSHPELLDYLANELIRHDWSLKWLHRQIVSSAAYQQQVTGGDVEQIEQFAGRAPRRLTAEQIIDSLHAATGQLRSQLGGPPVWPDLPEDVLQANPAFLDDNELKVKGWYPSPQSEVSVRALYWIQKRCTRIPIGEAFDQPDNATSCGRREQSVVPTQALALLNNELVFRAAAALAERVAAEHADVPGQIEALYARLLSRAPTHDEVALCEPFVAEHGLMMLCRALVNTNEFVYVD
jgi:hypothetical protein